MRSLGSALLALFCLLAAPAGAEVPLDGEAALSPWQKARRFSFNDPARKVALRGVVELGTFFVLDHKIQQSSDGTVFDYVAEGGQNSAFFFARVSGELEIVKRHTIILLYQPIDLRTSEPLRRDVRVDGLTFPAGTPMRYRYGFDFYRISYLYDFLKSPRHEIAIGLSLQMRVANIEWASLDGTLARQTQNLGPVPILKVRGRYTFTNSAFLGFEIDGIGIQFPSDLGSVTGVLVDASLRAGYSPTAFLETFFNVRYLGGGARGPGQTPEFGDGYIDNFLHTLSLSVGIGVK
jgi:hypothetical protein